MILYGDSFEDTTNCDDAIRCACGGENKVPTILQSPRGFNKGGEHDLCPTISSHSFECNNFVKEPIAVTAYDEQNNYVRKDGCVGTIMTDGSSPKKNNRIIEVSESATFVNGDVSKTVRASGHGSTDRHSWDMVECSNTLRIRKLTPKECFRLMGFDDESFHKAEAVCSNTQLYKQAGNSIVVDVLEELFCQMFDCRGRLHV